MDIVGDATEKKTLQDAEIEKADAVIISLPEDRQAVLSTLLARDYHSTTNIFVRVTESKAVERVKRAGADYVLELPDIAGRLLAAAVLDEPISATEDEILITRVNDPTRKTSTIESDRVICVTRNDELHLAPNPDFELQQDDLLICVKE